MSAASITNIGTGQHTCFDRLVINIKGKAAGYNVRYVSKVVQDRRFEGPYVPAGCLGRQLRGPHHPGPRCPRPAALQGLHPHRSRQRIHARGRRRPPLVTLDVTADKTGNRTRYSEAPLPRGGGAPLCPPPRSPGAGIPPAKDELLLPETAAIDDLSSREGTRGPDLTVESGILCAKFVRTARGMHRCSSSVQPGSL